MARHCIDSAMGMLGNSHLKIGKEKVRHFINSAMATRFHLDSKIMLVKAMPYLLLKAFHLYLEKWKQSIIKSILPMNGELFIFMKMGLDQNLPYLTLIQKKN